MYPYKGSFSAFLELFISKDGDEDFRKGHLQLRMPKKTIYDIDGEKFDCVDINGDLFPDSKYMDLDLIIPQIPECQGRDDDIVILTYPKAGTNWIWELCNMLLKGNAEITEQNKVSLMLEFMSSSVIDQLPSVRLLNTHIKPSLYPRDFVKRKCKIISVVRNPKDIVVSKYHHFTRMYPYKGSFSAFLELFLSKDDSFGSWFDYMKEWDGFFKAHKDIPVLHLCYEDMKMDLKPCVDQVDNFLNTNRSEDLKQQIVSMCQFDQLKLKSMNEMMKKVLKTGRNPIFRKGIIGDWKTHFTVAQNERFDQIYQEEMKGYSFSFEQFM